MTLKLCRGLLTGLLVTLAAQSHADAQSVRHVLLIQSIDRGSMVFDRTIDSFRHTLDARSPEPVTVAQFVLAPAGFTDAPELPLINFLRTAFADRSMPDLV